MVVTDFNPAEDSIEIGYNGGSQPVLTLAEVDGAVIVQLNGFDALRLEGQTLASMEGVTFTFAGLPV